MRGTVLPFPESGVRELDDPAAEVFTVTLEPGGKVALPEAVRRHLALTEGGKLVLRTQREGTVLMTSLKRVVDEARDQLIRERRARAGRESESRQ
jgi:bifunctional DNA-binding transcriptional regulator/antitoxin component of YhaV-PrlF toxin-antitoxin module